MWKSFMHGTRKKMKILKIVLENKSIQLKVGFRIIEIPYKNNDTSELVIQTTDF